MYKVKPCRYDEVMYDVVKITIVYGVRISAYESEPDKEIIEDVYDGSLSDCYAYIKLHEGGYME